MVILYLDMMQQLCELQEQDYVTSFTDHNRVSKDSDEILWHLIDTARNPPAASQ